jgi:hypothetical protein
MKSYVLNDQNCPACGRSIDRASPPQNASRDRPGDGDLMFCYYCTAFLEYDAAGKLHRVPGSKFLALSLRQRMTLERVRQGMLNIGL